MADAARRLIALEQCGLELQAPHMRSTTKRRIETSDVDVATLASDSLRFVGWAPEVLEASFRDLRPEASYAIEATYLCERDVRRVQAMTSRGLELHPPTELAMGTATVVRAVVPPAAYADGILELRVERIGGPDVVMSELRLFSSVPAAPVITVVGDSRGGLIGTVATADYAGVADARVRVTGDSGSFDVATDAAGVFRVPLREGVPLGQDGRVTLATGSGPVAAEASVDTRHVARGLRELPPAADRLDLSGDLGFTGGPFHGHRARTGAATARVPGHVIYDSLVPEDGVATLHRTFDVPPAWSGRSVFLRCDGAYGRAEVYVNDRLASVHGSGATSFDVDVTAFLRAGENELAITLTEFTPHAVLDDMSWYAHMSLLGIWRSIYLFSVPPLHLGQLDLDADWDPAYGSGTLRLGVDVINVAQKNVSYDLDVTIRDDTEAPIHRSSRHGTIDGATSARQTVATEPLAVLPWSAEEPRLYDLEVSIRAEGASAQAYHRRIGFRRVETRGDQLLVNVGSSRVDLQACKLEYSIVSPK